MELSKGVVVTKRERLLSTLGGADGQSVFVLCPGGMMSMAVAEVMSAAGVTWPCAHEDADSMVRLALAMQDATGFDNVAVPFCMTVEAQSFGARVDLGRLAGQPRVRGYLLASDGTGLLPQPSFGKGRAGVLLDAIRKAAAARPDLPVIGNLVGPFSLLGMLADPLALLRWTRRTPDLVAACLDAVATSLVEFGRLQIAAGAAVVCISEPTATGEILGGRIFASLVAPRLAQIARHLRAAGAGVILHICGDVGAIARELMWLPVDAVSFDSMVDVVSLASRKPPWLVMGNLSPFLLEAGPEKSIREAVRNLVRGGIRLIAPGCGVIPTTPLAHLCAVTAAAAKEAGWACAAPGADAVRRSQGRIAQ